MDDMKKNEPIHIVTPLIPSDILSELCGRPVLLKLDNLQPSGSFKIRGIGNFVQKGVKNGCKHIISSSGGNAGMASAYAARQMGVPSTVYLPSSTPKMMISRLKDEKASVVVHGRNWNEAHEKATEMAGSKDSCYVHPFDHPDVWEGHSTMVTEILEQCNTKPAAIVLSVGGGGLLCGIFQGLHKHGVPDIPVIAMETQGAHALNAALIAGKPVSIGEITSIAQCLGALCVTQGVFELKKGINISSHVISDKDAVEACLRFADDHRIMVQPACGAALAAGYSGVIQKLIADGPLPKEGPVVFIVCGGSAVTLQLLEDWKEKFNL